MAWIESHTVLLRHRKLIQLALDLKIKEVVAMGYLHALWHAALEQQEDGNLEKWSDEFLATVSQVESNPKAYRESLERNNWLNNGLIHDWLDYAGRWLMNKYATSNPEKLKLIWSIHGRVYGKNKHDLQGKQVFSKCLATGKQLESNNNLTLPNLTLPNQKKNIVPLIDSFEAFWRAYPRKEDKKNALKAWIKANPNLQVCLKALEAQKQSKQWTKREFIPMPSTWISGRRWEDEVQTEERDYIVDSPESFT